MRIISGKYKGKRIDPGKRFKARPTTDFAKEGIFNIIANHFDFEDLSILDLFAGTGSIGFEFASRGCKAIDTVELNPLHYGFIKKTALDLGFTCIKVFRVDSIKYIRQCKHTYHVIFADPPYDFNALADIPSLVFEHRLIQQGGWLILEHSRDYSFTSHTHFFSHRKYGNVNFTIFTA